jgi:hypothetical protein
VDVEAGRRPAGRRAPAEWKSGWRPHRSQHILAEVPSAAGYQGATSSSRALQSSSCFRGSSAMLLAIRSGHSPLRCRQGPASSPTSISEEQVRISNCAAAVSDESRPVPWRLVLFCISTAAIKNQTGQADFIASSWNKTLKLTLRVWCLDLPKRLHAHAPEVAPCAQPARFWARFPSQWCHGIVSRLEGCVVSHRSIRGWLDSNPSIPWR